MFEPIPIRCLHVGVGIQFALPMVERGEIFFMVIRNEQKTLSKTILTNIEKIEETLANSEKRYYALFNGSPDAIFIVDIETAMIVEANRNAFQKLGFSPDRIASMKISDIVAGNEFSNLIQELKNNSAESEGAVKTQYRNSGGIIGNVIIRYARLDLNGKRLCQCIFTDISDIVECEEKISSTELRYRTLFENSKDGISVYEVELESGKRKLIDCNESYARNAGRSIKELLDYPNDISDLQTSIFHPFSQKIFREMIFTEKSYEGSYSWIRPDHTENFIDFKAAPIKIGNRYFIYGIDRDVTENKLREKQVSESEALLKSTIESIPFDFFVIGKDGRYLIQNTMCKKNWGDLIGKTPSDVDVDPETTELWLSNNHRAFSGETIQGEWIFLDHGEIRAFYNVVSPIYHNEEIIGILGLNKDITEDKRMQNALKESERKYIRFLENLPDGCFVLDRDWRFIFANDAAAALVRFPKDDIIGVKLTDLYPDIEKTDVFKAYKKTMETGETIEVEAELILPGRRNHYFEIKVSAVPEGIVVINKDITQRKMMEEKSRLQQEQLVQADKLSSLGTLVSGVAHEINNPNAFVLSNAQLIQKTLNYVIPILDEYYEKNGEFLISGVNYSEFRNHLPEMCKGIIEGSRRIKNIVKELRNYAIHRPHSTQNEIDINDVVQAGITLLSNLIAKTTKHFDVRLNPHIPKIQGDFQRLEQVVINVIQNACQALENKYQAIRISTDYDADSEEIIIVVKDEGMGIPEDKIKNAIDPFYTTKRESGGTGLGLSISSNIIINHGGSMEFTSTEGGGATVTIKIPVAGSEDR